MTDSKTNINIPGGSISVSTYPLCLQGDMYRTFSKDYGLNFLLRTPKGLESFFEKASEDWGNHLQDKDLTYTPCIVNRKIQDEEGITSYLTPYFALPLAPPKISQSSEFFVPGLVVPDLKLIKICRAHDTYGAITGYIFSSDYLNHSQRFYAQSNAIKNAKINTRYMGLIEKLFTNGNNPLVKILLNFNDNPAVFAANSKKLDEITKSSEKFWWMI